MKYISERSDMYCWKCGAQLREKGRFCPLCGAEAPSSGSREKLNSVGATNSRKQMMPKTVHRGFEEEGFLDRYEDGGLTVGICVYGIILSIITLATCNGKWISMKMSMFGGSEEMTLLQASTASKNFAGLTQYFSADMTSTLSLVAFGATASFFILLLGGIAMLILSGIVLIKPTIDAVAFFINSILIRAFGIIGAIFVALPILQNDDFGFMPIPIVMVIIAGIPAVIIHFVL